MKKVKFEGKLSLKKKVVAKLNEAQMGNIKGGSAGVSEPTYYCTHPAYECGYAAPTTPAATC